MLLDRSARHVSLLIVVSMSKIVSIGVVRTGHHLYIVSIASRFVRFECDAREGVIHLPGWSAVWLTDDMVTMAEMCCLRDVEW